MYNFVFYFYFIKIYIIKDISFRGRIFALKYTDTLFRKGCSNTRYKRNSRTVTVYYFIASRYFERAEARSSSSNFDRSMKLFSSFFFLITMSRRTHTRIAFVTASISHFSDYREDERSRRWRKHRQSELIWAPRTRAWVSSSTGRSRSSPMTRATGPHRATWPSPTRRGWSATRPRTRSPWIPATPSSVSQKLLSHVAVTYRLLRRSCIRGCSISRWGRIFCAAALSINLTAFCFHILFVELFKKLSRYYCLRI